MPFWKYNLRGNALLFAITATTCQVFLLLGYDQGAMSGIIGADNAFGRNFDHPDAHMLGNIMAIFDIGCVLGSAFSYFVGEKLGRRRMLMIGGIVISLGAAVYGSSYTIAQLIAGRVIAGVGTGITSSTAPTFLSEFAPAEIRGALSTMQGTITILGISLFAILLVLQTIGLPESPRWLIAHGRVEEAGPVIAAVLGKPDNDMSVELIVLAVQKPMEEERRGGPFRFQELFTWGRTQNLCHLLLAISVQLGQQFSGATLVNYYTPVIFRTA